MIADCRSAGLKELINSSVAGVAGGEGDAGVEITLRAGGALGDGCADCDGDGEGDCALIVANTTQTKSRNKN